jgi:uncharacterized YigZ family protein
MRNSTDNECNGGVLRLTIFSSLPAVYIVQRSRFVAQAHRLSEPDAFHQHLQAMRQDFPAANHYTWAYRISEGQVRASDDGEPHGTAGLPILNLLTRQGWEDTLVVVVRYFGGIKLGRGGLVHAYQTAAAMALDQAIPGVKQRVVSADLEVDYAAFERLQRPLSAVALKVAPNFAVSVRLSVEVLTDRWLELVSALDRETHGQWTLVRREDGERVAPVSGLPSE